MVKRSKSVRRESVSEMLTLLTFHSPDGCTYQTTPRACIASLTMPLLRSALRSQAVDCFFCLCTSILPPKAGNQANGNVGEVGTRWNWKCERCHCWNIRDAVCRSCQAGDMARGEVEGRSRCNGRRMWIRGRGR